MISLALLIAFIASVVWTSIICFDSTNAAHKDAGEAIFVIAVLIAVPSIIGAAISIRSTAISVGIAVIGIIFNAFCLITKEEVIMDYSVPAMIGGALLILFALSISNKDNKVWAR